MADDKLADTGITEADITESIDELESLIAASSPPAKLQSEIPILRDIVDAAEVMKYTQGKSTNNESENKIENLTIERMNQLVDTVDRKLSSELDSHVDLLKETIKDSIIDELKEELKKSADQIESTPSETDSSDKPPE